MSTEVDGLRLSTAEKERNLQLLREQLDQKTKSCTSAEISLIHLNKTLDDLKSTFTGAKQHAEMVMGENDQLRADIRGLNGNLEVYSKQIENLS